LGLKINDKGKVRGRMDGKRLTYTKGNGNEDDFCTDIEIMKSMEYLFGL
jgi:hypothetical protein